MPATQLRPRRVEKPWGRMRLGAPFGDVPEGGDPVGEIWFEAPEEAPDALLVKYLFTAEKLSVQVHPGDDAARAAGLAQGKEECWVILAADPGAAIGLGLKQPVEADALRAAALDGSIEKLLDWKEVAAGDIFYLPAGTIHAIGGGISLVEVQQNADVTYRLYDYGRPRELHLDAALAVAHRGPWTPPSEPRESAPGRAVLAEGRKFTLERWSGEQREALDGSPDNPFWLIPIAGAGSLDVAALEPGSVWVADGEAELQFEGELLIACPGATTAEG